MGRQLAACIFIAVALFFPASAQADVGVYPVTKVVPVGGVIRGWATGSGMPVYLVPASAGPKRYPCHRTGICEPTAKRAPGKPFVLLGRLRRTTNLYARQSFGFRVPEDLRPGRYRMYLYCKPCGGSLIQSGSRLEGEIMRITARPASRTIRVDSGATRTRFLISQPEGVILLVRLTVPHGVHATVTGSIPRLASVIASTDDQASCRRRGAVDVCAPAYEWCPMPAAAWRFELRKLAGPAGAIRLDFRVGQPPSR